MPLRYWVLSRCIFTGTHGTQQLRQKLSGLSEAEQAQAAASLFDKEAMSGMLAILNGSLADFEKLSNAIDYI